MFLQLDKASVPMRLVYSLPQALKDNPKDVALAQALTLDATRPLLGLKGIYGLYGSQQWWASIEQRKMPLRFISGIIQRAYVTGMDECDENNTIDLLLEDGSILMEGIYVNNKTDIKLYREGCRVELVFVLDELKRQPAPDGNVNYLEIPLEVAVSLDAATLPN
jgi:hypothetical protein